MLNLWKKVCMLGQWMRSRTFAVSLLSLVLAFVVFQITTMTNVVYETNEGQRSIYFTMSSDLEPASQAVNASQMPQSESENSDVSAHYTEINTAHSYQIKVQVDGELKECEVRRGMTVGELLYEQGVSYDGNDLLSANEEKPLADGELVVLERVEYEEYTVEEPIAYETLHKNSSLIKVGQSKSVQKGKEGMRELTYVQRTVDGVKEDVQLLGERVAHAPVNEIVLIGSPAPVSGLDFDLLVDEHGKPLKFSKVLTNQVATGYSARQGAKTASGRYAITGHVAVNPKEIPYGSKLYITSADNKFIYGCAIAADTGTGLMADIVDVDLFYDTYQESVLNGRKIVDIYILE